MLLYISLPTTPPTLTQTVCHRSLFSRGVAIWPEFYFSSSQKCIWFQENLTRKNDPEVRLDPKGSF